MSNDRRDADAPQWPSGTEQQGAKDSPFTRSAPAANLFRSSGSDEATSQQPAVQESQPKQQARPQMQTGQRQSGDNEATAKHRPVTSSSSDQTGASTMDSSYVAVPASSAAARGSSSGSDTRSAADKGRRTRKARLRLSRIDPWSVMKTALLFSIAFGIISVVAVAVIWQIILASGALDSINNAAQALLGSQGQEFDLGRYVNGGRVIGFTALIAVPEVIIFTALATLFSFLYNLSATVLGGLEVTLAED